MHQNFIYGHISDALPGLARAVLGGDEQGSRNGRTRELTHVGVTLARPQQREILVEGRKANIAAQIAETMWVLSGRDDVTWLRHYLPRALDFSDDGERWRGAYGPRLRQWTSDDRVEAVDQWRHCMELLKADPLSRRAAMTIYDPAIDTEDGKDIPCNNWLVFTNRLGYLDLQVGIRSNDLMWGWSGINAFEWSVLLEISAKILGVRVGSLHFSIASLHLYEPHWEKAGRLEDLSLPPGLLKDSPRYDPAVPMRSVGGFDMLADEWFVLESAIRDGADTVNGIAVSELVDEFPEPMLRSWLRVLQWWWSGDHRWLAPLGGTHLEFATHVAMQPPVRHVSAAEPVAQEPTPAPTTLEAARTFVNEVSALHDQKHAAYGDSWKRRGEMLGIMANIARKIDRLGGSETDDETSADTACDLMVYLAKYRCWLFDQDNGTDWSSGTGWVNKRIADTSPASHAAVWDRAALEQDLRARFDDLETMVSSGAPEKRRAVDEMLSLAYVLAFHLWQQAQTVQTYPHETTRGEALRGTDDYRGADHE